MTGPVTGREVIHASCVALDGRGVLILGPSGAGKSALALQLMAGGATLVADDRVELRTVPVDPAQGEPASAPARLLARPVATIAGLIEARGVGILRVAHLEEAEIALVVDLSQSETERLPPRRHATLLGVQLPLVLRGADLHFQASVLCYLKGARHA